MAFGYFPDYRGKSLLIDWYLKIFGYPYASRRNEVRLVFKHLAATRCEFLLDLGCGDGIWTNYLAGREGVKIIAVDYSTLDLSKANWRKKIQGLKNVNYLAANAHHLPLENEVVDGAYSISTIEHIEDDKKALAEIWRVLKPGGRLVLSVPMDKTLPLINRLVKLPNTWKRLFQTTIQQANSEREYRKLFDKRFAHFRTYTQRGLTSKLNKLDFVIESFDYHIKFFGILPQLLVHSLKVFEWEKNVKSEYKFANMAIFPLTFPVFYPLYRLDDWIRINTGYAGIVVARKVKK